MKIRLSGTDALVNKLKSMSSVRFDSVCSKSLTDIFNRGKNGGTPVDTGEMRESMDFQKPDGNGFGGEVGYTVEYAPHVEYGHRTINGGFVQGQHFLQKNVDEQKPIFKQDLLDALKKG